MKDLLEANKKGIDFQSIINNSRKRKLKSPLIESVFGTKKQRAKIMKDISNKIYLAWEKKYKEREKNN